MSIHPRNAFLLANVALSFYLTGAIWAHEVDIFRSWKLIGPKDFAAVQRVHWHKLPYWIFTPLALALVGSIILIWYQPVGSPAWAVVGNLACQLLSLVLTAVTWGPWQARLSRDPAGAASIYLAKILRTHWIRTTLITVYACIMLAWAIEIGGTDRGPATGDQEQTARPVRMR